MAFGHVTIQAVDRAPGGTPDELGNYVLTETLFDMPGCRHRPLTFQEKIDLQFDIATEMWKSTIPLFEYDSTLQGKVKALGANDVIRVDGNDYQIVGGARPFDDFTRPFKATIISKLQTG